MPRTHRHCWSLLALALAGVPQARAEGPADTLVDRAELVVGKRLVTSSDLRLEEDLARYDVSPVPPLQAERRNPQLAMLRRSVIRELAGQAQIYQPSSHELEERIEALRIRLRDELPIFIARHDLDDDRLAGHLRMLMVAERYVHRNVGLTLRDRSDQGAYAAAYEQWITQRVGRVAVREIERQDTP